MTHRFYCPELTTSGLVLLKETEAHHLMHVLRHQVGDLVELFDGKRMAANCRVTTLRKRDVELEILDSRHETPRKIDLTLATAVPKGDRFDWLIEKATELGVRRLIPIVTTRSVVDPRSSKLDKLRQTVVAACKQSGRNDLMEITAVSSWTDFLRGISGNEQILIAHPQGTSIDAGSMEITETSRPIVATIGPEGGFSDDEFQGAISAGAIPIQLGPLILRIETAAIGLASKLLL